MDLFEEILKVDIEEATVKQLMRKQRSITRLFPTFHDRVKKVADAGGVRLDSVEDDLWHFKIHSASTEAWYDAYIHFKDVEETLAKVVKDRRLWVKDKSRIDRTKLARKMMNELDIQLIDSCPADKFYGGQYIRSLGKYDAMPGDKETRPPKVRNPKKYGAYCKHLASLLQVLPFYNDTMMRWLEDFYGAEIKTFEEETRKEYGWVKQVAQKLAKRAELEPEKEVDMAAEPKEPKKQVPKKVKVEPSYEVPEEEEEEPKKEEKPEEDSEEQKKLDREARRKKRKEARDDRNKRKPDSFRAAKEPSYPIDDEEEQE